MRLHVALASTFFFFALGTGGPAASTDNRPSEPQPVLMPFKLDQRFDRIRLIPGAKEALLVSAEQGQVVRYNLVDGSPLRTFKLPSVVDLVIDAAGRFAYLVALDPEVPASVLRLDLVEGRISIIPLPGKLADPKLALGANGLLILAGQGAGVAFVGPVAAFDAVPPAPVGFPAVGIPNDVPVAELAGLPGEDMVFLSAANAPAIYGLDTNTKQRHRLTALQQSGGAENRPLAMAIVTGAAGKDGKVAPAAVVGDQAGSRVMLFDYNPSFRALDFVVESTITVVDKGVQARSKAGSNPLIIAAANRLSAIVVGSRQAKPVYFFAREQERVLVQLNVESLGPVLDLDVAKDGSLAVILANEGRSLIRVDRPDTATPLKSSQGKEGADEEILKAQKDLAALGYPVGAADGMLGPSTINAIKLFQGRQGLSPTGALDPETKSRLEDEQQRRWHRDRAEFEKRFKEQGVRRFKADAFLPAKADACTISKPFPPDRTWCSAFLLAKTMDAFQDRLRGPVTIESAFQHRDCGDSSGDAAYSEFRALDFRSVRGDPAHWVKLLETMRDERLFEGRVEARGDRVHIELETAPELWVFAGWRSKDGNFASRNFEVAELPEAGKEQVLPPANLPMQLRDTAPRMEGKNPVFGKPVSLLKRNLALTVERVVEVDIKGLRQVWVGGQVVGSDATHALQSNWFVVIASHTTEVGAHRAAEQLRKSYPDFSFDVYLADNGWFAVVAGAGLDQGAAKRLVLEAQCAGLSNDAYMQLSETWKKKEAPPPDRSP